MYRLCTDLDDYVHRFLKRALRLLGYSVITNLDTLKDEFLVAVDFSTVTQQLGQRCADITPARHVYLVLVISFQ